MRRTAPLAAGILAALLMAPGAGAAVLYDQAGSASASQAPSSSEAPPYGRAADDFTVPAGQAWRLDSFDVIGMGGAGDRITYGLHANASGNFPAAGFPLAQSSPNVLSGFLPGSNDFTVPSETDRLLVPGTYWLEVVAGGTSPWSWATQSAQAGFGAAWAGEMPPSCNTANYSHRLSECGIAGADLRFRVSGRPVSPEFTLGPPKRRSNGGVELLGTFPGHGEFPIEGVKRNTVKAKPGLLHTGKLDANGMITKTVIINPSVAVKKKLKKGVKRVKAQVKIVFKMDTIPDGAAYESTQTITVKFKRPAAKKKRRKK